MLKKCKRILRNWLYDMKSPVQEARCLGVIIGNNVNLVSKPLWGSEPYLISIGDNTTVSFEVALLRMMPQRV